MTDRTYKDFFEDMKESVDDIEEFIKGMNFSEFKNDKKTIKAILKSIEDLGEASNNIPEEIKKEYNQIPWKYMIGMRNNLVHEYFGVDLEIVWETITEDIPRLKGLLQKIENDILDEEMG